MVNRTTLAIAYERVEPDAVEPLHAILRACGEDLRDRLGLRHWDPPYPIERFRADAVDRAVYALLDHGRAAGTFTIGTVPPSYYDAAVWTEPAARALYLNRMAVLPAEQRRGLGAACLGIVEQLARDAGCAAVRLDAIEANDAALRFYERAGYERRGTADWPAGRSVLFEKHLPGSTAVIVGEEREGR